MFKLIVFSLTLYLLQTRIDPSRGLKPELVNAEAKGDCLTEDSSATLEIFKFHRAMSQNPCII